MRFYSKLFRSDIAITLLDVYYDWQELRTEDPENHAANFKTEMFEILMATVNGRNDFEIVGLKASEVERLIARLKRVID